MRAILMILLIATIPVDRAQCEDGLIAEFFANPVLNGDPVHTTIFPGIDFKWRGDVPLDNVPDDFSARFSGTITAPVSGTWRMILTSDDGVRVWMDGSLVHDFWRGQGPTESEFAVDLVAGEALPIVIEYFDDHLGATLRLEWAGPIPREVVPASALQPVVVDTDARPLPLVAVPAEGVAVRVDTHSLASPAFFECAGAAGVPEALVYRHPDMATAVPVPLTVLDDHRAYGDLPLDPDHPVRLEIRQGGDSVVRTIHWRPADGAQAPGIVQVRSGDALLLSGCGPGSAQVADAYTDAAVAEWSGRGPHVQRFDQAGDFRLRLGGPGKGQGKGGDRTIAVTVVDAEWPLIACEIDFAKPVRVPVSPRSDLVAFSATDDVDLSHIDLSPSSDPAELLVKPRRRGEPRVAVRLGGQLAPIIAVREIDEFTIVSDFHAKGLFGWVDEQRFMHAPFGFTMDPVIPYTEVDVEIIVPGASIDGRTHFRVPADELDADGHWGSEIIVTRPSLTYTTCHRLMVIQVDESE